MKNSIRKFIQNLPGPKSYCGCNKLCSPLEIEHVVPISLLKQKKNKNYKKSINDPHNLFYVCSEINSKKSSALLLEDYMPPDRLHLSYLSRAALYMDWKYELSVSPELLLKWKYWALQSEIISFELEKNQTIVESELKYGDNPFLSEFPSKIINHT